MKATQRTPRPAEQYRMLAMLKHLHVFAELGLGGGLYRTDLHSREREDLLCDWVDIQRQLPRLDVREQQAILLVGLLEWTEDEAAEYLGITRPAVHTRLWQAAGHVLAGLAS